MQHLSVLMQPITLFLFYKAIYAWGDDSVGENACCRHDNLSLSQRFTWLKEKTDSCDFHRQAVAHAVSVWAVTRCRVFLIPCCLCYMSEAHTDICLTWLPFQCLSDLINKYLVHTQECQEPHFHRSFQWPTPPKTPAPPLLSTDEVWGWWCSVHTLLQTSQSWEFSFLILFVGQHKFFGQLKPMLLHNSILKDGSSVLGGSRWFRKHSTWAI